ncbi:MAG TPA: UDP-glucose 4-epimerase GalE [Candidatus Acidoferrales bacterium]|nr:UDP-glucose 4-epimerase GalE [Candidatus Acidoferrales bacterium]
MQILVTGAAGYIGSVCTEVLIARGHSVIALDDLSEGHKEALHPQARFCQVNLHDHAELNSVFSATQIDAVMHFAALCLVEQSVREPGTYYRANVAAGINLLDAMIQHGVKRFIFSSTAATYGEPKETPISEDHPTKPINPYGSSKLLFERILEEFKESTGLEYVVMRYFNAAGASEERGEDHHPESHILPILFEVVLGQRESFSIYGTDYPTPDGTCIRDYVHVIDIAESHVLALERISGVAGRVFNVGNSRGFSVREVIGAAEKITGRNIPTRAAPRRAGDPAELVASSSRIRSELGWSPRFSGLDSIIESAWAWKHRHRSGYSIEKK